MMSFGGVAWCEDPVKPSVAWWRWGAKENLVIIDSGNGLVPIWHQAITWAIADELGLFVRTWM